MLNAQNDTNPIYAPYTALGGQNVIEALKDTVRITPQALTGAEQAVIRENLGGGGTWPITCGGTGADTAAGALANLGLPCEIGTWTPTLVCASGAGPTYTGDLSGTYEKLGDMVYAKMRWSGTAGITDAGAGIIPAIGGLPYPPASEELYGVACSNYEMLKALYTNGSEAYNASGLWMYAISSGYLLLTRWSSVSKWIATTLSAAVGLQFIYRTA